MGGFMELRRCRAGRIGGIAALALLLVPAAWAQDPPPPLPPPRPDRQTEVEKPSRNEAPAEQRAAEGQGVETACLDRITKLGLRFERRPPVQEQSCGIEDPVFVTALSDSVEVAPASLMACPVAESLARWLMGVVSPEAERQFQSAPTKLLIGTTYQCRDQRNGEKLSEHAFGNGVDVIGFEFSKRPSLVIGTQPENSPEASFQSAIQKASCSIFNTVLGPGSDAAHGDHLHLDLRQRKGDYRICQ
jgi:hypothetical protein